MSEEFYSFDRALRELQMDEEELKKLISEGEIRAFRDDDRMKFRREDVEGLRGKGDQRPDVIEELETVVEEDSIPTLEMDSGDAVSEELIFDESDDSGEAGMATEQIPDASIFEEEEEIVEVPSGRERRTRRSKTTVVSTDTGSGDMLARPRSRSRKPEIEENTEGPAMLVLMIACTVVLFLGCFVAYGATTSRPTGPSEFVMNFVMDTFVN
ncbi:MAG: hypothetical protein RL885_04605 [Planctomycetota bacterium]